MIGILPCAGTAERFHNLPKFLLPCPGGYLLKRHVDAMKPHCDNVEIPCNVDTAWLVEVYAKNVYPFEATHHETMTQSVLSVIDDDMYPERMLEESIIFGMPDTYIEDENVYEKLAILLQSCDVALAAFKARPDQHRQGGMVAIDPLTYEVTEVVDKPDETALEYIWGALAWKPAFWDCLLPEMQHVGYGLPVAIERGLDVRAVVCEGGFWDCGTFDRYVEMLKAVT